MDQKISVIIPTFNRAHTIRDALNSVAIQTYSNWECLIIDDGSTDDSEDVIGNFIKGDNRFIFLQRPPNKRKGAASCRNIGLENLTGDYVQFLDSDDSIAANKFEVQQKALFRFGNAAVATCKFAIQRPGWVSPFTYKYLSTYQNFKNPLDLFSCFAKGFTYFPPHIYLTPTSIIRKAGFWNEELRVNDDGEYFSRVILNSSNIQFCSNTFAIYKTGAENRVTGELTQLSGLQNYVKCWEATDENIFEHTGIRNHLYVKAAKRNLYKRLLRENQDLLPRFETFLKDKWRYLPYLIHSLMHKANLKARRQ